MAMLRDARARTKDAGLDGIVGAQAGAERAPVQLRGKDLASQQTALDPNGQGFAAQSAALAPGVVQRRAGGADKGARARVARAATAAAEQVAAERRAEPRKIGATEDSEHPVLKRLGEIVGLGLGIIVTEALRLVPGWNDPVVDADGEQVDEIEGATRIGDYPIRKRHEEVVGPKIEAYVETLPEGRIHELLEGLGEGASRAPGESYRLEVGAAKMLGM